MNNDFQTIMVTGASSGIGYETCQHFLNLGFSVIGLSRKEPNISHDNFKRLDCDLSDDTSVISAVRTIPSNTLLTALVNCAGVTHPSPHLPGIEAFKSTFEVNLFGTYRIIYHCLPFLKNKNGSSIINIASIGGLLGFPNNPAYGASKSALINLSQNLSIDLSDMGIRVNTISPGYFRTEMTKYSYDNPKLRKLREDHTILKRYGETKELLGIIEFLVSENSSYVTGQNFIVDGGWVSKGLKI